MGGTKKKSMGAAEKQQQVEAAPKKTEKKGKDAKLSQAIAKEKALIMPKLDDKQLVKTFASIKAITVYSASRILGLNASTANTYLRSLEARSAIRKVGGYSGRYVYTLNLKTE